VNRRRFLALSVLLVALSAPPALADDLAKGPRPGKYRIMSYGATNKPPLFLGSFELAARTYKAYAPGDKLTGDGKWSYDAKSHTVKWDTGPYAGVWGGEFTVDREGKTHKIRLKRTTIATNG
jgi:hypothetical protein